mmetsp:Transcript_3526/g.2111  ORF Transcript_3526/g.2111 Transcript_3526/m.2111 type:complete len:629 (+) Transcript_3526:315-2201(+)
MKFSFKSFYSVSGVILTFVVLVLINVGISKVNFRLDTTQEKLYSLSDSTINILDDLKKNIYIKVFYSKDALNTYSHIRNYAKRVIDFLNEYRLYGNGRIKLEIYDTVVDSFEEDEAKKYKIQSINLPSGDRIYFGLVAVANKHEEIIPMLDPAREMYLEYDITRIITMVSASKKKKIGIISSLPVFGFSPINFSMINKVSEPWLFISELEKTYEVTEISLSAEKIYDDIDLLIIIHPKNLNKQLEYAIDQYILSGRNVLIFVDPFSLSDESNTLIKSSSLERLFTAWKIKIDPLKAILDFTYSTKLSTQHGGVEDNPLWISAYGKAFNQDNVITSQLEKVLMPLAGAIFKEQECQYEFEPLISSSINSNLDIDFKTKIALDETKKDFIPSNEIYNLAVKIRGRFETAFPDGKPEKEILKKENKTDADEKENDEPKEKSLKKGTDVSTIIITADTDILSDDYYVSRQNFFGFNISQIFNDNLNFFSNAVEVLTGTQELISIRTIGKFARPFTKVMELEEKAKRKWLATEQRLVKKAKETNAKLKQLSEAKDSSSNVVISKEQEEEFKKFYEEKIEINKELKRVRRNLKAEIVSLGRRIKFFNILFIPLLVIITGIVFAYHRQRKSSKFR